MILPDLIYHYPLNNFCIVGINYRKSDTNIRGKFSLTAERNFLLLKQAVSRGIPGFFILSTCNRTEVYGICYDPDTLIEMLFENTKCSREEFSNYIYSYRGTKAIEHLLKVASGLDSQIIGDYEILSQLKLSVKTARQCGAVNGFMERIINYAFQASKEIKTKTRISSGTVSVSYAAIEIIKENYKDIINKKILLVGTGKFGNHIARNLKEYFPGSLISLINRTDEKSYKLAGDCNANFIPYRNLPSACDDADIIIVNSSAPYYTVLPDFFLSAKTKLILDLSVPANVDPRTKNIHGVTLMNVDEVSLILDKTISQRQAEIPKAMEIINKTLLEVKDWHCHYSNNSFLVKVKSGLNQLNKVYFNDDETPRLIHKTISSLAIELKQTPNKGCQCILALNKFLQMNEESNLVTDKNLE